MGFFMSENSKEHATTSEILAWVESFLVDCEIRNLSPHTIRFYRFDLANFTRYCQKQSINTLETLTADHLRRFLLWLKSEGHNPGGVHAHYRVCKTFIRWWVIEVESRDYKNIFQKVKPPKLDDTPLPPVQNEHIKTLLNTCGRDWHSLRDKALILALLDTGVHPRTEGEEQKRYR